MRILNIWENQRYLCVYMYIHLGKFQILGKFIGLGLFLLQDTAGSTGIWDYPEYSSDLSIDLDKEANNPKSPKVAVKWQNLPNQHRIFPNLWDNCCVISH